MDHFEQRRAQVVHTLAKVRTLLPGERVGRKRLARALTALGALAARQELWPARAFPEPAAGEVVARYRISEDADRRFALYLHVMPPGERVPPHDHATWSCIAAVSGLVHHELYVCLDRTAEPNRARVELAGRIDVAPGRGLALLPEDIHAVEARDSGVSRHLHLYGRSLEAVSGRLSYDPDAGTCWPREAGAPSA